MRDTMIEPLMSMRCPKCGHWVDFRYCDTAGYHWICPVCKNNSESQTITFASTTTYYPNNKNYVDFTELIKGEDYNGSN